MFDTLFIVYVSTKYDLLESPSKTNYIIYLLIHFRRIGLCSHLNPLKGL